MDEQSQLRHTRFCSTCKQNVELHPDPKRRDEFFMASGHSAQKVRRLQRNLGRKWRPADWQVSRDG